jgi:hypothetical protein
LQLVLQWFFELLIASIAPALSDIYKNLIGMAIPNQSNFYQFKDVKDTEIRGS